MNTKMMLWLLVLCIAAQAWRLDAEDSKSSKKSKFKTKSVNSSIQIYDLFEYDADSIFIISFYLSDSEEHNKKIDQLESILAKDKSLFDKVIYVPVESSDQYQFGGILYDLNINTAPRWNYPYFLIIQDKNGQLVRGEKSVDIIQNVIHRFL